MKKSPSQKSKTPVIIIGVVVCIALIALVVLLIRVVIISGSALLKNAGETPIETQSPDEVWVSPTMEPLDEWDQGDINDYVPNVEENEHFDQTGEDDSIPVDAKAEDLAGTTAVPDETDGNLFDPIDTDEDGF